MRTQLLHDECPYCLFATNKVASKKSRGLAAGDITLCWNCGRWRRFEKARGGLTSRRLTEEEERDIGSNPECCAALEAWQKGRKP